METGAPHCGHCKSTCLLGSSKLLTALIAEHRLGQVFRPAMGTNFGAALLNRLAAPGAEFILGGQILAALRASGQNHQRVAAGRAELGLRGNRIFAGRAG